MNDIIKHSFQALRVNHGYSQTRQDPDFKPPVEKFKFFVCLCNMKKPKKLVERTPKMCILVSLKKSSTVHSVS